jgi:phosphoribosylformylglycinamidine synthase
VCDVVRSLVADGLVAGIHDVADGGMAAALVEMVAGSGVGARLAGIDGHGELFAEGASRVLVCVAPADVDAVTGRGLEAGVDVAVLGETGGDRLVVDDLVDLPVPQVVAAWRDPLPLAFSVSAVSG